VNTQLLWRWLQRRPVTPPPTYVREWEGGLLNMEYVEHIDGIDWHHAPAPPKWHRCWAQTRAVLHFEFVRRCPCGGITFDGKYWLDRNTRTPAARTGQQHVGQQRYLADLDVED